MHPMLGEDHVTAKAAEIGELCRRFGVTRLRLFGSALQDNWDPDSSDFDFLAEFDRNISLNAYDQFMGFILELETLLGRKVDVVDWNAAKNPFFRKLAESQAKEVYAA